MKLKCEFEKIELDDNIMAVPVGEDAEEVQGVLRLNETAAVILDLLKEETSEEKIVEEMLKEYDSSREEITEYVHEYIQQLYQEGLIV